jgi:uncharacterized protein (TIGR03083 family)
LLGVLSGMDEADWERSTACSPWPVKDVVAHLVDFEVRAGSVYRGEAAQLYPDPANVDRTNAEGVVRWRALPGDALRSSLWQHGSAAQRVMDRLDESSPAARIMRIHFIELGVHGHDITDAIERPPVWGDRVEALVRTLAAAAPGALARNEVTADGSVSIEIADDGAFTIAPASSGGWELRDGAGAETSIAMDAETFVLATVGRVDTDAALARSRISGDEELAARVLSGSRVL